MNIEELVEKMTSDLNQANRPAACSDDAISRADQRFAKEFNFALPEAYKRVLRRADGVMHNGLIVWSIDKHPIFRQTIFDANADMRENFDDRFLYFGQWDEELYVFDLTQQQYCAIEFVGKPVWIEFDDDVQMFEFMLQRAWG